MTVPPTCRIRSTITSLLACAAWWVINPDSRRAWIYTGEGSREVKDGLLHNPAGDLALPLTFLFPG